MTHTIDALRDLAGVGRAELRLEEVDMSELGHQIVDELRALQPGREVQFESGPAVTAVGDMTLIRLLLTNLLQNSWKYTGPSDRPRIQLGVESGESEVPTYYVQDNGIGFDNDQRERIFEVFERLHAAAAKKAKKKFIPPVTPPPDPQRPPGAPADTWPRARSRAGQETR